MGRLNGFVARVRNHISRKRGDRLYRLHGSTGERVIWSGNYYAHHLSRGVARVAGRMAHSREIELNANARVLVVCHLFYFSALPEIREYLDNLAPYHPKFIFTYARDFCSPSELESLRADYDNVELRPYDNLGYDLAPFLDVLENVNLEDYDVVVKLHSKSTERERLVYGLRFGRREWFVRLFDGVVGPFTVHQMIDTLLNDRQVGLVAESKCLSFVDPPYIRRMICDRLSKRGLPLPVDNYHFVGGTCFAARAQALQALKDLHIVSHDFENVRYGVFSLAHALEREMCSLVMAQGLELRGIDTHPLWAWWSNRIAQRMYAKNIHLIPRELGLRFADDDLLCMDWSFAASWGIETVKLGSLNFLSQDNRPMHLEDMDSAYARRNGDAWVPSSEANEFVNAHFMVRDDATLSDMEELPWSQAIIVNQDYWIVCGHDVAYALCNQFGTDATVDVIRFVDA